MTERIVATFWMAHGGLSPVTGRGYVERARALARRGEVTGGALVAFGAQGCAVAFEPEGLSEAVDLAVAAVLEETEAGEIAWTVALSQGELEPFVGDDVRGLSWGAALAAGSALARAGDAGEVLLDASLQGRGELVRLGARVVRDGGRRVRGAILDVAQPWRHVASAQVGRIVTPPLVGREDPSTLLWMPGSLAVLRADPGLGGTRLLLEVRDLVAPGPCLLVMPSGSGLEPYGALRRALARARVADASHLEPELEPALRRLLAGDGVPFDTAGAIIASYLRYVDDAHPPGALLIDDGTEVDLASIEACARAVARSEHAFPCVVRLDATTAPPPALAALARGPEMDLKPLDGPDAEALAGSVLGGALDEAGRKRWARRGGYTPLGIIEAICVGLSSGEILWADGAVSARRRSAGRGKPRPASRWIAMRAEMMGSAIEQLVLALIAMIGGDAPLERVERVLAAANVKVDARAEAKGLVQRRWLIEPQPGWVALPTRSHRDAIMGELNDEALRSLMHRAIARVLEEEERGLALAEAAHHVARAGDGKTAARIALACARTSGSLELGQAAMHLLAFAREQDPSCEEEARAQLATSIPTRASTRPSAPPAEEHRTEVPVSQTVAAPSGPKTDPRGHDSEPPTVAFESAGGFREEAGPLTIAVAPAAGDEAPPSPGPGTIIGVGEPAPRVLPTTTTTLPPETMSDPPAASEAPTSANVGDRLTELAKEALLGADTRSLERWTEGLVASGEHGRFAERMQAILRIARGDVGEALRVLRAARAEIDQKASPAERCQTSLALGVALAVAGRPDEALLEALDALARAREHGDDKGSHACLAFLAKLYTSVDRAEDAARLRRFARIADEAQVTT